MSLIYKLINAVFGTYYDEDMIYKHHTIIKRNKNPSFPKLRGLVDIYGDKDPKGHTQGMKLYFSKHKLRNIKKIMEKVDEEHKSSGSNLSVEFPQASKRPFRKFPD